jgi:hypothetical protein
MVSPQRTVRYSYNKVQGPPIIVGWTMVVSTTPIWGMNLCMNHMVHVSNTMWRIKNQSYNSTSCSDNALHLLVLVVGRLFWGLQVMSSFAIWGCVLKGCFERGIFWRAKSRLKGIEDFNLEHWLGHVLVLGIFATCQVLSYALLMSCPLGSIIIFWKHEESRFKGKIHFFPKSIAIKKGIFVQLIVTSLNVV